MPFAFNVDSMTLCYTLSKAPFEVKENYNHCQGEDIQKVRYMAGCSESSASMRKGWFPDGTSVEGHA